MLILLYLNSKVKLLVIKNYKKVYRTNKNIKLHKRFHFTKKSQTICRIYYNLLKRKKIKLITFISFMFKKMITL